MSFRRAPADDDDELEGLPELIPHPSAPKTEARKPAESRKIDGKKQEQHKVEQKPEPKQEVKLEPKQEVKAAAEPKVEAKSEPKTETKPEPKKPSGKGDGGDDSDEDLPDLISPKAGAPIIDDSASKTKGGKQAVKQTSALPSTKDASKAIGKSAASEDSTEILSATFKGNQFYNCLTLIQEPNAVAISCSPDSIEISSSDKDSADFSMMSFARKALGDEVKLGEKNKRPSFSLTKQSRTKLLRYLKQNQWCDVRMSVEMESKRIFLQSLKSGEGSECIQGEIKILNGPPISPHMTKVFDKSATVDCFALCNALSHLSQFGTSVDVVLEGKKLILRVGSHLLSLSCVSANVAWTVRSLSIYRFIDVTRTALRLSDKSSTLKLNFVADSSSIFAEYEEAAVKMKFLLKEVKEGKKKG